MNEATGDIQVSAPAAGKVSPERYSEGMTLQEYVNSMGRNRELFLDNYSNFTLDPTSAGALRALPGDLNVLVLAEDWCGDVLRYVPALARMADFMPGWNVRVFKRDDNLDLADMWLKEGKYRAIPVVVFLDGAMNELACYIEKPAAIGAFEQDARAEFAAERPDLPDANMPPTQMSGMTNALFSDFLRRYRIRNITTWQRYFVEEIIEKLRAAGS